MQGQPQPFGPGLPMPAMLTVGPGGWILARFDFPPLLRASPDGGRMLARVKYIIIDRKNRHSGTYKKQTHEDTWSDLETDANSDTLAGDVGKEIHDQLYGVADRRFFVKVLGLEVLGE